MNTRERLAADISAATDHWNLPILGTDAELIAVELEEKGYRKPRTITAAEELDALAEGSMILDADPDALLKDEDGRWLSLHDADNVPYSSGAITFPATVLYEPSA